MATAKLLIEGEQRAFLPGERLVVVVQWELPQPPTYIELALVWFTQGKGDRDYKVVERLKLENVPQSGTRRMAVQLPDSPWSFSGKLISLLWALELTSYPGKHRDRQEFVMAPGRSEILLHETKQGMDA